jgi:small GTP-binding protein
MGVLSKKICTIGDFGVGKTSLIRRYVEGVFSDEYLSTVGVKVSQKLLDIYPANGEEAIQLKLMIWDLEGHTRFKPIAKSYLQGASGALIVADITRPDTVENLNDRIQLFLSVNPNGIVAIALNKIDLAIAEKLDESATFSRWNDERIISFNLTSAKVGNNVEKIFQDLSTGILTQKINSI